MTAHNRVGPSPISNVSEDITTSEGGEWQFFYFLCTINYGILKDKKIVEKFVRLNPSLFLHCPIIWT